MDLNTLSVRIDGKYLLVIPIEIELCRHSKYKDEYRIKDYSKNIKKLKKFMKI